MDTKEPLKFLAHYGFKGIFTVISHIFFREIKTTDAHLVPSSGPCIFIVGPHANQFIDGVVIHSINPRLTHTLMADVSYQKPLIGHIGKILNAIPVVRPQDIINEGSGRIFYDPINDPNMIRGENTHFLSEINARDYIIFGRNYKIHVANIFSDTKLEIIYSIKLDAGTIGHNGVPYKIAPYIDQTPVYEEVFRCLNSGQCVTVFPEGGSHDRTELLPLKTGFAVMALEALVKNPKLDIKIIPIGLNYFHPHKFRSRAVVSFGQPISISIDSVDMYKLGGDEKREAVMNVVDICDIALKAVTVNAPDYDTLMPEDSISPV
ncbi:hypothetical protein BDB01DRAFT_128421 [Pilobolus umbonatus]|nr:hypothetical protein BDB01DRAFT_128421 [Pilobolus umbonatus]